MWPITDVLNRKDEMPDKISIGTLLLGHNNEVCEMVQVGVKQCCLVLLANGNYMTDTITVQSSANITAHEFEQMVSSDDDMSEWQVLSGWAEAFEYLCPGATVMRSDPAASYHVSHTCIDKYTPLCNNFEPVKPPLTREQFLADFKACGIVAGDLVEVTRSPAEEEKQAWGGFSWGMKGCFDKDVFIGKQFRVKGALKGRPAYVLETTDPHCYYFPHCVLKKVDEPVVWWSRDPDSEYVFVTRKKPEIVGGVFDVLGMGIIDSAIPTKDWQRRYGFTPHYGSCGSMTEADYEKGK